MSDVAMKFIDFPKLDERHVGAETVDECDYICIYTDKMHIDVRSARQLRDWLNAVIPSEAGAKKTSGNVNRVMSGRMRGRRRADEQ